MPPASGPTVSSSAALGLGIFTGVVSLIAMIRLVDAADLGSTLAWIFVLLAMLPWIGYCGIRARHGSLTILAAGAVGALCLLGLAVVWLFTLGPVLALAASLAAFVVIWVHDWPPKQQSEDHFVRIEELATDESAR